MQLYSIHWSCESPQEFFHLTACKFHKQMEGVEAEKIETFSRFRKSEEVKKF